jgi:hypothetical protein
MHQLLCIYIYYADSIIPPAIQTINDETTATRTNCTAV